MTYQTRIMPYSEITTQLKEYGVPDYQITGLIDKLKNGQPWDSLSGEPEVSREVYYLDNKEYDLSRFEDGSVVVSSLPNMDSVDIELADSIDEVDDIQPAKAWISSCQYSRKPGYRRASECKADMNAGIVAINFEFGYTYRRGGAAKLDYYSNPFYVVPGIATKEGFTKNGKSAVTYSVNFNSAGVFSSKAWLKARVTKLGEFAT